MAVVFVAISLICSSAQSSAPEFQALLSLTGHNKLSVDNDENHVGIVHAQSIGKMGSRTASRKILQVHGPGHTGTSFLGSLLFDQGLPYLYEPNSKKLKSTVWLDDGMVAEHLKCAYTCAEECADLAVHGPADDHNGTVRKVVHWKSNTFDSFCDPKWKVVGIKTVHENLHDIKMLHDLLPSSTLSHVKFLITMRDPRGIMHSSSLGWAANRNDPAYICGKPLLTYLSAKELLQDFGPEHVRLAIYEQWSQEVETFVPEWFAWAGIGSPKGKPKSDHASSVFRWKDDLSAEHLEMMSDPACVRWFEVTAYPSQPASLADYNISAILGRFQAPLTDDERATLTTMRGQGVWQKLGGRRSLPFELQMPAAK